MTRLRAEKIAKIEVPDVEVEGDKDDAELLIVGFGGTYGHLHAAMDELVYQEGLAFHLIELVGNETVYFHAQVSGKLSHVLLGHHYFLVALHHLCRILGQRIDELEVGEGHFLACGAEFVHSGVQMAEIGVPPYKKAVISGIGCSSRLPHYMNTYGMNTIHGRAAAIATGCKVANPELTVWQVSGDGDGLAIF